MFCVLRFKELEENVYYKIPVNLQVKAGHAELFTYPERPVAQRPSEASDRWRCREKSNARPIAKRATRTKKKEIRNQYLNRQRAASTKRSAQSSEGKYPGF